MMKPVNTEARRTRYIASLQVFWGILVLAACGVNPAERNNAGNWYTRQGDYDSAVSAYQSAQVVEPDNPLFYFNAAAALAGSGNVEGAAAALQQAIQRGDNAMKVKAFYNLGNLYFEQEMYVEAVSAYQQALLLDPNYADARHNLEVALLFVERPTPTALEQKTRPEQQQADASATPTPNPAAQSQPSPTPTPPPQGIPEGPTPAAGSIGQQETGENKGTPRPNPEGDFTAEEAKKILDQVKQDQPGIGGMPDYQITPATPPSGKDW